MTTKQLTRMTMMACILSVVFEVFSHILYVELITFTLLCFGLSFSKREVISSAALFALIHMLITGVTPWSIGYLIMYPLFAWIFVSSNTWLLKHPMMIPIVCGIFSFLGGQLMDIPFIVFSSKITIIYILMGLKTSLIQGLLSFMVTLFLWEPVVKVFQQIRRKGTV